MLFSHPPIHALIFWLEKNHSLTGRDRFILKGRVYLIKYDVCEIHPSDCGLGELRLQSDDLLEWQVATLF